MSNNYYITEIEIKNLWHQFSLKTTLNKDLNLFIGINGSGKTTLINIIKGILKVDLPLLFDIDFDRVILKLQNAQKQSKTISLERKDKFIFKFKVSNKIYEVQFNPERGEWYKYNKLGLGYYYNKRKLDELKESFKTIFSIRSISVYRQLDSESNVFWEENEYNKKIINPIDKKIEDLEQKFIRYKGLINLEINKISEKFRKDVFRKILTTESAGNIIKTLTSTQKNMEIDEIKRALKNLGLSEKNDKSIIDGFLNKKQKIEPNNNDKKSLEEYLIFIFVVYNLTQIINLSNEMEASKKKEEEPIDKFISITNTFLKSSKFNKQIYLEHNSLKIKNKNEDVMDLKALSSGEKQLLILLMETLLQKQDSTIYIIDEPELSLHVAWQRELVGSILKLNPNIQLIIATHSPEIVANYKHNIISMESIVR